MLVLAGVAAVMGAWWAASRETRIATYRVIGTLSAVELDLGAAPVEIAGGAGGAVEVRPHRALRLRPAAARRRAAWRAAS